MRVYVAGSSEEIAWARAVIDRLKGYVTVTFDWTKDFEENLKLSKTQQGALAELCVIGAKKCDELVMLYSGKKSFGAFFEMGAAYASGKPISIISESGQFDHFFGLLGRVSVFQSIDHWLDYHLEHGGLK